MKELRPKNTFSMNKGNKATSKKIIIIHDLHLRNYAFMRY